MTDTTPAASLATLLTELVEGPPQTGGYMLNRGDMGLVRSLDRLTSAQASTILTGGTSIAAHVDHVTYALSLMNRWAAGENPWHGADWKASWRRTTVSDEGWARLRQSLADEAKKWTAAIKQPREMNEQELTGMIGSIAHLAYHFGAIRQMDRKIAGPSANNEQDAFMSSP